MTETKKPRKTRKDKGKKRGKRIKNPRLQTGSIDFRHIGTTATMGQNLTALAGLVASSRPAFPTFSQDQYLINELRKKEEDVKNNELVIKKQDLIIKQQNIPPQPSFEPDTEQGQEEASPTEQVRRAMGNRIANLRKELETNKNLSAQEIKDLQNKIDKTEYEYEILDYTTFEKMIDLQEELRREKQQGQNFMDKMVDLENQRQLLEEERNYFAQEAENLTGLSRQQQRELEARNEEIRQAQQRIMRQEQTLDEEIKRGLQFKDEQLRQAETSNAELKGKLIGLEQTYEANKSQLEELKREMKEGVISKKEYDSKVKELSSTIKELDKNLKYVREQERKASSLVGKQQLEKNVLQQQLEQQQLEKEKLSQELTQIKGESVDEYEQYNANRVKFAMGNSIKHLRQEMDRQLEQQRDQFEEERQALKGKILEAESDRDLYEQEKDFYKKNLLKSGLEKFFISKMAFKQEQEMNEEARVSNEILGMTTEDLLVERTRRKPPVYEYGGGGGAIQDLRRGQEAVEMNFNPVNLQQEILEVGDVDLQDLPTPPPSPKLKKKSKKKQSQSAAETLSQPVPTSELIRPQIQSAAEIPSQPVPTSELRGPQTSTKLSLDDMLALLDEEESYVEDKWLRTWNNEDYHSSDNN